MKEIKCSFGIDIDSVAGWIGSYGGQDRPSDIQRGVFATEVGVPRLLRLFEKYDMKSTFFIPGHTMDSFPKEMEMIKKADHEIGAHGYMHENPVAMTLQQEEDILEDNNGVENDSDDNSEDKTESQDEDNVTEDAEGT